MTGKIVLSIALAAACAYLYWKIQKRKRAAAEAAEAAAKAVENPETAETALQKVRAHFEDENAYQRFLRSKCTLDAKHEPACAGGTCEVEVEEVEVETQVEQKESAPVVSKAKVVAKPKGKTRARKSAKAQTVINLDEPQTVGEEK